MNSVSIPKCFVKFNPQNQQSLVSLISQMDTLIIGIYATKDSYVVCNLKETQIELFVEFVKNFEQFDSQYIEYLIQTFGVHTNYHAQGYDLIFNRYSLFKYNLCNGVQLYGFMLEELHIKNTVKTVNSLGFEQHPKNVYSDYDRALNALNGYIEYITASTKSTQRNTEWQIVPVKSCVDV